MFTGSWSIKYQIYACNVFLLKLRAFLLEFERKTTGQEAVNKYKPWPGRGSWVRGREKARLFEPDVKEESWVGTGDLGV